MAICSPRGSYEGIRPLLRPIITPGMGKVRPRFLIPLAEGDPMGLGGGAFVELQLHAVGYSTQRERFELTKFRLPRIQG